MTQRYRYSYIIMVFLLGSMASSVAGQERWTQARVVAEALRANPGLGAAEASAEAASAEAGAAQAYLWPSVSVGAGWTRSDDPVFAFGAKLRQERFTEQDFALDALNRPGAIDDWSTSVRAEWSVLSPARWSGAEAGRAQARAARWGARAAAHEVRFHARVLFHRAVTADARFRAASANLEARRESERVIGRRVEEGVLMEVDLLQARAERQAAEAELHGAESARDDARSRLAVLLARPASELGEFVAPELELDAVAAVPEAGVRPELHAQEALVAAAREQANSAGRSRLPQFSAFASWNTYSPDFLDGVTSRWTGGLMLQVPVFTGFATERKIDAARAQARAAELQLEDLRRRTDAERAEALRAVRTARDVALSARAAEAAATEALQLMERRFEEGLATPLDLLTAQSQTARLRYRSIEAGSHYQIALARLEWATAQPLNDRELAR